MTNNTKHEDALLKMGIGYFREHILKILGIEYRYRINGTSRTDNTFFVYGFYISDNTGYVYSCGIPDDK